MGIGEHGVGEQGIGFDGLGAEDRVGGLGYVLIENVVVDAAGIGINIRWIGLIGPVHQVLRLTTVMVDDVMRGRKISHRQRVVTHNESICAVTGKSIIGRLPPFRSGRAQR